MLAIGNGESRTTIDIDKINNDILDLSVQNPNIIEEIDVRTPEQIISEIEEMDIKSSESIKKIKALIK